MPVGLFPIGEAHYYGLTDDASNVTSTNCSSGIQWIYKVLGDCVEDPKGISSVALGLASIFAWMVVSIPQMVKNCRNIAGVEGISILLILQWTLGDATNLVGAILTNQLPLQIYLAIYFVFADLILFSQYLYYQIWKRKQANQQQGSGPRAVPKIVLCFTGAFIGTNLFGAAIYNSPLNRDQNMHIMHHSAGRSLLGTNLHHSAVIFHGFKDQMGYAIGVVSSIFYIGSRSAQLYKNYKRQSTDGLSVLMFWLAILGNLTYGLAILVRQLDSVYVIRHVPWLVGSLGVILLDASLLVQFKYYGSNGGYVRLYSQEIVVDQDIVQKGDQKKLSMSAAVLDSQGQYGAIITLVVQFKYYGSGEDFDRLSQEPLLQDQEIVVNGDHLKYDTIN